MSRRLDWDKAKRDSVAAQRAFQRSRPLHGKPHHDWKITLAPRPPYAPPRGLGFRRYANAWVAYFKSKQTVFSVIKQLKVLGWHGRGSRVTPASDVPSSGIQDRNGTPATNDRPDM